MFERLQERLQKNQRNLRKMAARRMPMRRKSSGPFSARWLVIAAAVAVPVALLLRRMRQGMEHEQGMVPATGMAAPVQELDRTHYEEVGKGMSVTATPEPSVTHSQSAVPPMASEDSPVEVAGPSGLRQAEMDKEMGVTRSQAYNEPDLRGNDYLPEGQSPVQPAELTAPDRQVEQQAPPEMDATKLDDFRVIEGIGPGITMILHRSGIATYRQLADTSLERLQELMKEANISQITDPTTWSEQAELAAQGDWKALDDMQSHLRAGRRVD